MAKKTPKQLDREIAAIARDAQLEGRFDDAKKIREQDPAFKAITPTDTNKFALTELVIKNGGHVVFPNRIDRVDAPHLRRCMAANLIIAQGRATLSLTPAGIAVVLPRLHESALIARGHVDIARGRGPSYKREEDRATERLRQINAAISTLQGGG